MTFIDRHTALVRASARALNTLQSPVALAVRLWVSWQFLVSGYLKVATWENTLFLFENEYRVPLLQSHVAAVVGTTGELAFPALLVLGVAGRLSAELIAEMRNRQPEHLCAVSAGDALLMRPLLLHASGRSSSAEAGSNEGDANQRSGGPGTCKKW